MDLSAELAKELLSEHGSINEFELYFCGLHQGLFPEMALSRLLKHVSSIIEMEKNHFLNSDEKINMLSILLKKRRKEVEKEIPDFRNYYEQIKMLIHESQIEDRYDIFYLGSLKGACLNADSKTLFQHVKNINSMVSQHFITDKEKEWLIHLMRKQLMEIQKEKNFYSKTSSAKESEAGQEILKFTIKKGEIQLLIDDAESVVGFDLFFIGFYYGTALETNLKQLFKHVKDICDMERDGTLNQQEKQIWMNSFFNKLRKESVELWDDYEDFSTYNARLLLRLNLTREFEVFLLGLYSAIYEKAGVAAFTEYLQSILQMEQNGFLTNQEKLSLISAIVNRDQFQFLKILPEENLCNEGSEHETLKKHCSIDADGSHKTTMDKQELLDEVNLNTTIEKISIESVKSDFQISKMNEKNCSEKFTNIKEEENLHFNLKSSKSISFWLFDLQAQKRDHLGNDISKNSTKQSSPHSSNQPENELNLFDGELNLSQKDKNKTIKADKAPSKELGSHSRKKFNILKEEKRDDIMDTEISILHREQSPKHSPQQKKIELVPSSSEVSSKTKRISLIDQIIQSEEAQEQILGKFVTSNEGHAAPEKLEIVKSNQKANNAQHWKSRTTELRFLSHDQAKINSPKVVNFKDSESELQDKRVKENLTQNKLLTFEEEEELSIALIRQLQLEEEREIEYRRKLKMEQDNQDALCSVCYEILVSQKFRVLENCGHIFHDNCLAEFVKTEIKSQKFPLACPSMDCRIELTSVDMRELVEGKMLEQYYESTLKQYIETHQDELSCCPTADCKFAFVKEPYQALFNCPVCKKSYCILCKVDYHRGMTCEEFKLTLDPKSNEESFERFVTKMNFKKCPKCEVWVEKEWGCDHMSCKCGYAFCYNCGKSKGEDRKDLDHSCDCYEKMAATNQALYTKYHSEGLFFGVRRTNTQKNEEIIQTAEVPKTLTNESEAISNTQNNPRDNFNSPDS